MLSNWSVLAVRNFIFFLFLAFLPAFAQAASLRVTPDTGVFVAGNTFSVRIIVNTEGKAINAADAELSFNPRELSVISVAKGSLFTLWTLEPTFSNGAGTVSFGGGSPTGYTGSNGTILTVTFKALAAGAPRVNYKSGSILAADGLGTNILTTMTGGTYTIEAAGSTPLPEYVPTVNAPPEPTVVSPTHPDESKWYTKIPATFTWKIPSGVTSVRTSFDQNASTIPTKLYETPITERTIDDPPQGTSYFHIQFKNADGWGRVRHFRVNIDSEEPESFSITDVTANTSNPERTLEFQIQDVSPILRYEVSIDGTAAVSFEDLKGEKRYTTEALAPGAHTIVVTAHDSAGNTRVATAEIKIDALPTPVFTEYPERFGDGVIPLFRGTASPGSEVTATVRDENEHEQLFTARTNDEGVFTLIPNERFAVGVYRMTAHARGEQNEQSVESDAIQFIVEEPGYMRIGSLVIRTLSIIIPLISLVLLLVFGTWFLWHRLSTWRKRVLKETLDAESKLKTEFSLLIERVHSHISDIREVRKSKLTKAEESLYSDLEHDLIETQGKLKKEIMDIENIVQ